MAEAARMGMMVVGVSIKMDSAKRQQRAFLASQECLLTKGHRSAVWPHLGSLSTSVFSFWMALASGCVSTGPYEYGRFHPSRPTGTDVTTVAVEYGAPNKTLDRIGNILGTPAKLLSLNSKIDNHHVSDETIDKLTIYMEKNDITDVYVAVNDYSPKDQWRRMKENERISPGWKYTAGTLRWVGYTIMPGRLFGGTEYNPYTNTLYVNSDVPAVLLAEAAYAKDIHSRQFPGTYAVFANGLPVVKIWRQSKAVGDVLGYARVEQDWDVEQETYRVMYPQMGASTFGGAGVLITGAPGSLTSFVVGPLLGASGAVAGHAAGRTMSKRREAELKHVAACNELLTNDEREIPPDEKLNEIHDERVGEEGNVQKKQIIQISHEDEHSELSADEEGGSDSDDPEQRTLRQRD